MSIAGRFTSEAQRIVDEDQLVGHASFPELKKGELFGRRDDEIAYAIYAPATTVLAGRLAFVSDQHGILEIRIRELSRQVTQILMSAVERSHLARQIEDDHAYRAQIFRSMPLALCTLSQEHTVGIANAGFAETIDRPIEDCVGLSIEELGILGADHPRFDSVEPGGSLRWESDVAASDGIRTMSWMLAPLTRSADGSPEFIVAGSDITDQKRLQAQLRAAKKWKPSGGSRGESPTISTIS